ncbi:MAG: tetratricopeptide repeat protein [Caldimonas sp.]
MRVIRVDQRWLPVAAVPNNLPQQLASFVGRAKELDEIRRRLESVRLLTLTGSGGCGKTRLALQCAAESLGFHPDGVWLVELAALSNPDLVPQTVATALGLKEQPGKSLTRTVTDRLGPKQVLLVLDNAEHLLDATAQLAEAVLISCPKATLLVSSREALGIAGEAVYRVPSLSLPDPHREPTPESLEGCEAVLLFIVRVRAHTPRFVLSRANAPAVASICQRLDGIPLAIELAGARVRSMAVEEVNQRLDQRFRLLTGGLRTALPRQQTLRSLIDWSYDLLHSNEQALFRRLAVFSGGWTLGEAETVCVDDGDDGTAVPDLLGSLVDKSLVVAEDCGGAMRFRTLETVRQYARDRLLESGEVEVWRNRHLSCFVALAEEAGPQLHGPQQQSWIDRLETEHDNMRAALEWCSRIDSLAESGLRLAGALWPFWSVHGYLAEGSGWLSRVLAGAPDLRSDWHASALSGAGELARIQGDHAAARSLQERSLAIRRELGNRRGVSQSLTHLGTLAMRQADYTAARALIEEGLAIQRELGDRAGLASSLGNLGLLASDLGDFARARVLQEECLAIKREVGDQRGVAIAWFNLGNVAAEQGDHPAARKVFGESLAEFRSIGDTRAEAQVLNNLALLASDQGDHRAAASLFKQGLVIQHQLGHRLGIAWSLEGLARASLDLADIGRALRLWSSVERLRDEIGAPLSPHQRALVDKHVAAARIAVATGADFDRLWQEGHAMTLDQVVAYALEAPA